MRASAAVTTLGAVLSLVPAAPAAGLVRADYLYRRTIAGSPGRPLRLQPDARLLAHARAGFADLRIVDARGAEVPWRPAPEPSAAPRIRRGTRSRIERRARRRTVLTLDLGMRGIPVDQLRVTAATHRYERPVVVLGSDDGLRFARLAAGRIVRFGSNRLAAIGLASRRRYLRLVVLNGDDPPLRRLRVSAWSRSRALLIEGGHRPPLAALYGDRAAAAPEYDFARLPLPPATARRAVAASLGRERPNPAYRPPAVPPDRRSFIARHPALVTVALAVAAVALGAAGLLALRGSRLSL